MTDIERLPDPGPVLTNLPRGAGVILRHPDAHQLKQLAKRILPHARTLGLKVLIANDIRLALRVRADGVHMSEQAARRGPMRITSRPPGFIITAAAHGALAIHHASHAGAQAVLVSPVFPTASHPQIKPLGIVRFSYLVRQGRLAVIALGGIRTSNIHHLTLSRAYGFAAIGAWLN